MTPKEEKKLEMLLNLVNLPEEKTESKDQPRDQKGRFTDQKKFKFDSDEVIWVPINEHTFIRRKKSRYALWDSLIIFFTLGVIALVL